MTRRTKTVTITSAGRDHGKRFLLTEMSAYDGEKWANELLFGLMNQGVDIPKGVLDAGMAGVAAIGIKLLGSLPYEKAEPLLARMWSCVAILPDPKSDALRPLLPDGDIEEISTIYQLRGEILDLHFNFFSLVTSLKSLFSSDVTKSDGTQSSTQTFPQR